MPSTATDRLDGLTTSVAVKAPCKAYTTSTITQSGEQTIGGVACVDGDRYLYDVGTSAAGIWVVRTGAHERAKDFDGNRDVVQGTLVVVASANDTASMYRVSTANPIVIGTTAIDFVPAGLEDAANVTFLQAGTGAVARTVQDKAREFISVKDFGAVGDGVTNDAPAVQAAVDYAESLIGTAPFNDINVAIYFPHGKYLLSSEVTVTDNGIGFFGPVGRGATIYGNNILFNVGDYTHTVRVRFVSFVWLNFVSSSATNSTAAIKLYRTTTTRFLWCSFNGFDVSIDTYRASTPKVTLCFFASAGRTAQATAFIRMQGTDETATTGDTYSPGGGIHLTDCEFLGAGTGVDTTSGVLLMSVDGFYMNQCHFTGCVRALDVAPDATPANHYIFDIHVSNCYFDEPSTIVSSPKNVRIGGTVKQTITMASGATQASAYQGIRFDNCYFRGSDEADRCAVVQVTDGDSWWDYGTRTLRDIRFVGCTLKQATLCALQIYGAGNSPTDTYVEPYGVEVIGGCIEDNASGGATGLGSAITAQCESIKIIGVTFGPNSGSSDYVVSVIPTDAGEDAARPSAMVVANDFSKATQYTTRALNITQSETGADVIQSGNLYPGTGRHINETYKISTSNATTTTIWDYVVPQGSSGFVRADVCGATSDGASAIVYTAEVGFRRNGVGTTLSSGGSTWTAVRSWNPDAFATPPDFDLSTNTLRVRVTGIAATNIDWIVNLTMSLSR